MVVSVVECYDDRGGDGCTQGLFNCYSYNGQRLVMHITDKTYGIRQLFELLGFGRVHVAAYSGSRALWMNFELISKNGNPRWIRARIFWYWQGVWKKFSILEEICIPSVWWRLRPCGLILRGKNDVSCLLIWSWSSLPILCKGKCERILSMNSSRGKWYQWIDFYRLREARKFLVKVTLLDDQKRFLIRKSQPLAFNLKLAVCLSIEKGYTKVFTILKKRISSRFGQVFMHVHVAWNIDDSWFR